MSEAWIRGAAVALLAIAGFLAAPRPLQPPGFRRVLRHLQPSIHNFSTAKLSSMTQRTWLRNDFDLVLSTSDYQRWLLSLTRLVSAAALIALGVTSIWEPPIVAAALTACFAICIALIPIGLLHDTATKIRRSSEQDLYKLLSQLANLLSSGYSLPAAIIRMAENAPGVWQEHLARVKVSLDHGVELPNALEQLAQRLYTHRLSRALLLLASAYRNHTAFAVCERLAEQEAESVYNRLLAEGERRLQLVWIPVAIATLVPGILLLIAPLAESFKSISGA